MLEISPFQSRDEQGFLVRWNDRMEALADGSSVIESCLSTIEGDIPYLFNGFPTRLNGTLYLVGIGLDVAEQKRLEAALEREAATDALTGLHNRHRFDTEMERALAFHTRYDTPTALVMIDVDHFKWVNDAYGHDVGDRVLVELARRLVGQIRTTDFLARWGGEEIAVLLVETGPAEAARMAERLRQCIEAKRDGRNRIVVSIGDRARSAGPVSGPPLEQVAKD